MSSRPLYFGLPYFTLRAILLGILLAIILAASNTYLALKIGMLTSASIPAAIISMGILRFFKNSSIHENNLVQTAASAGEAIAGGIVYTAPALIIIHYWTHFSYLHNFLIALIGGGLGVLFSVPLRRVLMEDKTLRFPEGQAITRVLQMGNENKALLKFLLIGGALGSIVEFAQTGLQIIASQIQGFFKIGKSIFGAGCGFSTTLIGAGYLMGISLGISLLIGAITANIIILPVISHGYINSDQMSVDAFAQNLMGHQLKFIAIGSMLASGIATLISLFKPIVKGIYTSIKAFNTKEDEKDLPFSMIIIGIVLFLLPTAFLLNKTLSFNVFGFSTSISILSCILFILIIGFIFSAICGYFSGMVGVSASPGSAIVIGGLLIAAFGLRLIFNIYNISLTPAVILNASAIVIVLISVITGIACLTDNMQDLKVGHLIGTSPKSQQIMLFVGVIAASSIVPLCMELLFKVYGIANVLPHTGMDPAKALAAPVPAALATITQAVFDKDLPLNLLFIGAGITVVFIGVNFYLKKYTRFYLSPLGIAIGLYLPLSSSTALFLGSLLSYITKSERNTLSACGIVAGAALMDVFLAIPFALSGNPNVLSLLPANMKALPLVLAAVMLGILGLIFYRNSKKHDADVHEK